MKKNRFISFALAVVLIASLLAGCGASYAKGAASGMNGVSSYAAKTEAAAEYAEDMAAIEMPAAPASGAESGSTAIPQNRKWIITVNMNTETDDLDALTAALNRKIQSLGGYIEDQNIYNGSTYSSRRYRNANFTVRVPADAVDEFTDEVAGIANVISRNKTLQDVTLNYSATENRVNALKTEETRLLELLAKAENMSDLLEIEARLSDVRYELQNYGSQLKLYDNQIDFATIYLSISEVQEYTPIEEPTVWERIRDGFKGSLKGVGNGILDFVVFILANLPYLVIYAALIAAAVALVRRYRRNAPARKEAQLRRQEAYLQKKQEQLRKKQEKTQQPPKE